MIKGMFSVAGFQGVGRLSSWNKPMAAVIAASGIVAPCLALKLNLPETDRTTYVLE